MDHALRLYERIGWWVLPIVLGLVLAALGNTFNPYLVHLAISWIAFGLAAFALDMVWGKGGDLSLGHVTFYGLGGYMYGVVAINLQPVLGNTVLMAIVAGAIIGFLVATVVGYFLFYGRLGPLQTTIITYTFTLVLYVASIGFTQQIGEAYVGGDNGMTGIPPLSLGFGPEAAPLARIDVYMTAIAIAVAVYIAVRAVLRSPFGLVIDGTRLNLLKTELLGYDVRLYRTALFAMSGAVAGIGGAIFASWAAYINPDVFGITQALLVPIYVLVGGRGTLAGGFLGAVFIGGLSFWLGGGVVGGQTTLILGLALIGLVMAFPVGLLGGLRQLTAAVSRRGGFRLAPARILPEATGAEELSSRPAPRGEVALETRGLTKHFGGVTACDNVSLQFRDRGIHCIIGPNGAGKSTLLNTCLGLIKPDEGAVILCGSEITGWEPYRRVNDGLGIKLQVARILEDLTSWDNLWLAAYAKLRDRRKADARTRRILETVGLTDKAFERAGSLSHGEQQWLDIGMVLSLDPRIILLDEPTAGMTGQETQKTAELLRELARHAGIVVVEHDMEFVRMLEAPVTVLHQGAVFAEGTIDELRQDERILDIYLGRHHGA